MNVTVPEPRHTLALRKPNRRERLAYRVLGTYPDSYVSLRLEALHRDELEMRLWLVAAQRRLREFGPEA